MKIGVFFQNNGPQSSIHPRLAKRLIESSRSVMPDVQIYHLTDDKTEQLEGTDGVYRLGAGMPMAVRRVTHHASLPGEWLFVDTDIIFQKDVRDVFNNTFDICLTDRIGTEMEGTQFAKQMPYNMGVTFSRNPLFWTEVAIHLKTMNRDHQHWMGDQFVVCEMAKHFQKHGFNIKIIPGRVYNYPPAAYDDYSHASIVHWKGVSRKRQMVA